MNEYSKWLKADGENNPPLAGDNSTSMSKSGYCKCGHKKEWHETHKLGWCKLTFSQWELFRCDCTQFQDAKEAMYTLT